LGRVSSSKRERSRQAAREAVAQTGGLEAPAAPRARPQDPFTGELRRREVLPLLVLHLIADGPSYGNQLMERIGDMTAGVLSVNPNTMYPLLRQLESRGLIEGRWEHPERRTRRYYSLTDAGRGEYERLVAEVRPFLDSVKSSIEQIVREVYGR
jgi:DNA-binding PadR family transcriptional regulator